MSEEITANETNDQAPATPAPVLAAPDDTAPARRIAEGRTVDVFEQQGDWWWVTDPPTPALWMRAAVLAMSGERE